MSQSLRWLLLVGFHVSIVTVAEPQPLRGALGVELNGGAYIPAAPFGTFGMAAGKEQSAKTIGGTVTYRFARQQQLGIGATANWVWGLATRIAPTAACTDNCNPGSIAGGRSLLALVIVDWQPTTPIGPLSLTGGAGFKSYLNGGAISACDNQFCYDSGYFAGSLTNLAGQLSLGWRPGKRFPVGLRATDVVSRYKTGRVQHNLLFLLTLRPL